MLTATYLPLPFVTVVSLCAVSQEVVAQLRRHAVTDPLTGVVNRTGLAMAADTVRGLDSRSGRPTAVVAIDLDDFKDYNDRYGHPAGDALLVSLVAGWSSVLRRSDVLARVGGDEFVIVLSGADDEHVHGLLCRLRAAAPDSWSAGWVSWTDDCDLRAAIAAADLALYRAKRSRPAARQVIVPPSRVEPPWTP